MRKHFDGLLLTCEHGGHRVPEGYAALFRGKDAVLRSHRGWDPGAIDIARYVARVLHMPLVSATLTRLLVELNRSIHHPRVFSEFTRPLPRAERDAIAERYYWPHRQAVAAHLSDLLTVHRRVLHFGVHTFTPRLDGVQRMADVALLYDPGRPLERKCADALLMEFDRRLPGLRLRRNYPYRGKDDGLTTSLRKALPASRYLGIELEVNQALRDQPQLWNRLKSALVGCLQTVGGNA